MAATITTEDKRAVLALASTPSESWQATFQVCLLFVMLVPARSCTFLHASIIASIVPVVELVEALGQQTPLADDGSAVSASYQHSENLKYLKNPGATTDEVLVTVLVCN